jgi:hypothetical protein
MHRHLITYLGHSQENGVEKPLYHISILFSNQEDSSFIPNECTRTCTLKSTKQCPKVDEAHDARTYCAQFYVIDIGIQLNNAS